MVGFIGFTQFAPLKNCLSWAIACAVLGSMTHNALAAATLYKWQDEEGTVHYSERPPAGVTEFEKVVSDYSPGNSVTTTEVGAEPESEKIATPNHENQQQNRRSTAASQERCDKARKNLEALNSFARIRIQDENGEMRFLNEEEISSRKMETKTILEDECSN